MGCLCSWGHGAGLCELLRHSHSPAGTSFCSSLTQPSSPNAGSTLVHKPGQIVGMEGVLPSRGADQVLTEESRSGVGSRSMVNQSGKSHHRRTLCF